MFCRKLIVLNGCDEFTNVKGMLAFEVNDTGISVRVDLFSLPERIDAYDIITCIDKELAKVSVSGKSKITQTLSITAPIDAQSQIEAAVMCGSKIVAIGSNFQSSKNTILEKIQASTNTVLPNANRTFIDNSALNSTSSNSSNITSSTEKTSVYSPKYAHMDDNYHTVNIEKNASSAKFDFSKNSKCDDIQQQNHNNSPMHNDNNSQNQRYNDTQIAQENYYPPRYSAGESGLTKNNFSTVNEFDVNKSIDMPNTQEQHISAASSDIVGGYHSIYKPQFARSMRPTNANSGQNTKSVPKYYNSVKETLDKLFSTCQPENILNNSLAPSKWVRVNYKDDLYYCVGLVGKTPEYIGYAIPGTYSLNPPRQMESSCKWMPLSSHSPKGDGYWMMFQDCVSGQSVDINRR